MNNSNEDTLGKGAIESPADARDYQLSFIAGAPAPVDWNAGLRLQEPPDSDQRNSDACVAEATSYFNWQLRKKKFSVKSVFAYIAQDYGAYIKDGPLRVVTHGQETFDETPDPNPKTVSNMRSKEGLNPNDALDDQAARLFMTGGSPELIAQAVRDWKGCLFGLVVGSTGWEDKTNPNPPKPSAGGTGHALYAFGYHMHDGQKCIIAKSSWCRNGHHEHHIRENYFSSGYVYSTAYVLVPKEQLPMATRYIVQKGGKLGVLVSLDGAFDDVISWAKSEEHFTQLKKQKEIPDNAPRIIYP